MSYRTDWMDCRTHVREIEQLVDTGEFGDHAAEVSMALTVLEGKLDEALREIQIAQQLQIIDSADHNRTVAEERITDLGGAK